MVKHLKIVSKCKNRYKRKKTEEFHFTLWFRTKPIRIRIKSLNMTVLVPSLLLQLPHRPERSDC